MSETPKQTVIENGTEFDGTIKSACPISVSGKMKGRLDAPTLTVTSSGAVHGQVRVTQLKSQGEIAGEIQADTVELSGRVSDQTVINAQTLEVKLNQPGGGLQVMFGNCELNVGQKADRGGKDQRNKVEQRHEPKGEPVL
jgi:cytoskeletal protein CcmA (bactofilin family)